LTDNALSVSGLSPQREKHIKNPLTNEYSASEELIAVEGASPLTAEALSTALYAAPDDDRRHILNNYAGYKAYSIVCGNRGESIVDEIG
jgi:thiamine biosynthesis lipoprotein ApbE